MRHRIVNHLSGDNLSLGSVKAWQLPVFLSLLVCFWMLAVVLDKNIRIWMKSVFQLADKVNYLHVLTKVDHLFWTYFVPSSIYFFQDSSYILDLEL